MSLIVFSCLDRVLLEADKSDLATARDTLKQLQSRGIPLILVSNLTRATVEAWQKDLNLNAPFIVEYGSGIFLPNDSQLDFSATIPQGNYYLKQLGCTYTEARAALKAIQEDISKILRGFGDLDDTDIKKLANISLETAKQTKAREFSEIFSTPSRIPPETLETTAEEYGFKVLAGQSFSAVVGGDAKTKTAIEWLLRSYQARNPEEKTISVGLGTSDRSRELLETVAMPIVIPITGAQDAEDSAGNWKKTTNKDFAGWLEALNLVLAIED